MNLVPRQYSALFLILLAWAIPCYLISSYHFESQLESLIEKKKLLADNHAKQMTEVIDARLANLYGIPDFLSKTIRVNRAIQLNFKNQNTLASSEKQRLWLKNDRLVDLDQLLEVAQKDFRLNHIFVLNADGDCIGSSLWLSSSSCIGLNFSERKFFKANKEGMKGMQYAMGKTTHKGGLFFAVPIQIDDKFYGSVVAKYDVENLATILKSNETFILDDNNVIIYSSFPNAELKTFNTNLTDKLSEKEIRDIYQSNNIPSIKLAHWHNKYQLTYIRSISIDYPFLLAYKKIEPLGLTAVVAEPVKEVSKLSATKNYYFLMLTILGGALILIFVITNELILRNEPISREKTM